MKKKNLRHFAVLMMTAWFVLPALADSYTLPHKFILVPDPEDATKSYQVASTDGISNDTYLTNNFRYEKALCGTETAVFRVSTSLIEVSEPVKKITITSLRTLRHDNGIEALIDELYILDSDGNRKSLTVADITCNAIESEYGAVIDALCNNEVSTSPYWGSGANASLAPHTITITLPEAMDKFQVVFENIYNDWRINNMPFEIQIDGEGDATVLLPVLTAQISDAKKIASRTWNSIDANAASNLTSLISTIESELAGGTMTASAIEARMAELQSAVIAVQTEAVTLPCKFMMVPDPEDATKSYQVASTDGISNDSYLTNNFRFEKALCGTETAVFRVFTPYMKLDEAVKKITITSLRTLRHDNGIEALIDELYILDADGNRTSLTVADITCNAIESEYGAVIDALCNSQVSTWPYWGSGANASLAPHTITITLPEAMDKFQVVFENVYNDWRINNMPFEIQIDGEGDATVLLSVLTAQISDAKKIASRTWNSIDANAASNLTSLISTIESELAGGTMTASAINARMAELHSAVIAVQTEAITLPCTFMMVPDPEDATKSYQVASTDGISNDTYLTNNFRFEKALCGTETAVFRVFTPYMKLDKAVKEITITSLRTLRHDNGIEALIDELYVLDADGNRKSLTVDNITCNAIESEYGAVIDALCNNEVSGWPYWGSGANASLAPHTITITLPEVMDKFQVVFENVYNDWRINNMPFEIRIDGDSYDKTINYTYATLCLPYAAKVPEGVEAYVASGYGDESVTLTKLEDGVVPANTGVVVGAEVAGVYTFTKTTGDAYTGTNYLKGVTEKTAYALVDGKSAYVLMPVEGKAKFCLVEGGSFGANTAYLELPSGGSETIGLRFGDATKISNIETTPENVVIYDLMGRKVEKATKGIYIVNNKKVLVK